MHDERSENDEPPREIAAQHRTHRLGERHADAPLGEPVEGGQAGSEARQQAEPGDEGRPCGDRQRRAASEPSRVVAWPPGQEEGERHDAEREVRTLEMSAGSARSPTTTPSAPGGAALSRSAHKPPEEESGSPAPSRNSRPSVAKLALASASQAAIAPAPTPSPAARAAPTKARSHARSHRPREGHARPFPDRRSACPTAPANSVRGIRNAGSAGMWAKSSHPARSASASSKLSRRVKASPTKSAPAEYRPATNAIDLRSFAGRLL